MQLNKIDDEKASEIIEFLEGLLKYLKGGGGDVELY